MSTPFVNFTGPERPFIATNPGAKSSTTGSKTTGAKRGRKPKGAASAATSPRAPSQGPLPPESSQPTTLQWPNVAASSSSSPTPATFNIPVHPATAAPDASEHEHAPPVNASANIVISLPGDNTAGATSARESPAARTPAPGAGPAPGTAVPAAEDDVEGEDEMLPAMADDDYSAQLSFQSQSKDNLKVLMDNFSGGQYDRFEAYRRHALPKQAVRKVIQQSLGQQVSQPVAQVVAGFAKVFVGEIVEKGEVPVLLQWLVCRSNSVFPRIQLVLFSSSEEMRVRCRRTTFVRHTGYIKWRPVVWEPQDL
ncbi:hypothetical protein EIP91_003733 [Steccherinum ochraceum]|uniref:TAFII28-like protein domain-containing protein n=1 Tax=Steccherinum ochraceum TaxID=92696 RepID=A0A4R0RNK7_9APHY|nr:hypothetical protein EIP91_003733 [Steccherinum ochraceum]